MTDMQRLKEIFSGESINCEQFFERLQARPDILSEFTSAAETAALQAQLEAEKAAREKDSADFANEMAAARRDMLIDMALSRSGAKNIKAVRALVKEEAVMLQNGMLSGMEEEIDRLSKDCPYLFGARTTGVNPPAPAAGTAAVLPDERERWRTEAGLPPSPKTKV